MQDSSYISEDKLIDEVYELALDASKLDDFIYTWERFLSQDNLCQHNQGSGSPKISSVLERHF